MKKILILMLLLSGLFSAAFLYAEDVEDMISNTAPAVDPAIEAAKAAVGGGGMSFPAIIWGLIFSSIGTGFFIYGKKKNNMLVMGLSAALIGYPYVVQNLTLIVIIGIVLTGALWMFRK